MIPSMVGCGSGGGALVRTGDWCVIARLLTVFEFVQLLEDDGGVGAIGDVFADVLVGDFSVCVDDEYGGCGYAVVVQVVDVVRLGDFFALGGVEDGEGGSGVCDHGSCALEIVHADGEYFGVLLLDARVVALQLDELPEADASEESSVEDEDNVLVVLEIGECYVSGAVRDRKREVRRGFAAGRRI